MDTHTKKTKRDDPPQNRLLSKRLPATIGNKKNLQRGFRWPAATSNVLAERPNLYGHASAASKSLHFKIENIHIQSYYVKDITNGKCAGH
jgi:hypothetical protein